ncbi:MAG: molybdopterin-dependent oxidoreductase [Chloroflexi bacterium]|nr:molybdopterin-dependent oxidoreductase [Chloroflexota bacterium]
MVADTQEQRVVKTLCGMCGIHCGMTVTLDSAGNVIDSSGMVEHVMSKVCVRGATQSVAEFLNHEERLRQPLLRENGKLVPISWDRAMDVMVQKLAGIKAKHGPDALSLLYGDPVGLRETRHLPQWFARAFGTSNCASGAGLCHYTNEIAMELTFGHFVLPSLRGTKCIVLWGTNPLASAHPMAEMIRFCVKDDAKLIVIDPRRTGLAKLATVHLPIMPGTDGALALAMLNVIINEGLYDRDFVQEWTVGFDDLKAAVQEWSPERAAGVCGVSANLIVEAARLYGGNRPSSIVEYTTPEHNPNATQTVRAISCLIAITGNFDVPGGNTYVRGLDIHAPELPELSAERRIGAKEYPIFCEISKEAQPVSFIDALLEEDPPLRAMIVQGANPMATWPNTNRTREALSRLEFLVVMDPFMSETAELAHLVLPAASFLERVELVDYGYYQTLPLASLTIPVREPVGESWPDWKLWLELAQRLGLGRYMPWKDIEEVIAFQLEGTETNLDLIRENPRGHFYAKRAVKRYRIENFATPSGKCELYSQRMADHGYSPVPTWSEPAESPAGSPQLAREFPFVFTTGGRLSSFTHSQFHNSPSMMAVNPKPLLDINDEDAAALGIVDSDPVAVESPRGRIDVYAKVTPDIVRGVVQIAHGWPGNANANLLVDHENRCPISGYPPYKVGLCKVTKRSE